MTFTPQVPGATSGEAAEVAGEFETLLGNITGQGEDIMTSFKNTSMKFNDLLAEDIRGAGAINHANWEEAALACVVIQDVATQWSEDLEEYESSIASLQYLVDNVAPYVSATPEPPKVSPRELYYQSLQRMADEYWADLTSAAEWCSERIAGGTSPANVAELVKAGRLGWLPFNIGGSDMPTPIEAEEGIEDGEDLEEMLASGEIDQDRYNEIMFVVNLLNERAERAQRNGEKLTDDEIEYLENMYEALEQIGEVDGVEGSGGAISIPEIIEQNVENERIRNELLRELGGGMLTLSDERIGGGFSKLPDSIINTVQGPIISPNGLDITADHEQFGQDLKNLTALLGSASDHLEAGTRFSQDLSLHMGLILSDESGDIGPTFDGSLVSVLGESSMEILLEVSTRNIAANHELLTGQYENGSLDDGRRDQVVRDALLGFLTYGEKFDSEEAGETDYSKDDFERGGLTAVFDWISDGEVNFDPETQKLAAESMAGLVNFMSDPENHQFLMGHADSTYEAGGISRDAADSLADAFTSHIYSFANGASISDGSSIGEPSPGLAAEFGFDSDSGTVVMSAEDRVRFLEVLMTDERSAVNVYSDTSLFGTSQIIRSVEDGSTESYANESAILSSIVNAALDNEASYRDIGNQALRAEREQMWDMSTSLISAGISDSKVTSMIPGYGTFESMTLGAIKEQLIATPTPSSSHDVETGSIENGAIGTRMDLYLVERMMEEYKSDPENSPNPFLATNGNVQEGDLATLSQYGIVGGGFEEMELDRDVANEYLGSNRAGEKDSISEALNNVMKDTPMSWLDNDERTGGLHSVGYEQTYEGTYGTLYGELKNDSESLKTRDAQYKDTWETWEQESSERGIEEREYWTNRRQEIDEANENWEREREEVWELND
ncbi:hypothetical protein [Nocardiopsis sp. B62]|uniref:TPR repeat region-containing protein n=1 Tax=Nocardiopsis sp. B62 TaxID=2824874 RepID=UPI001B35A3A5|nr:hypothetical protein [Nocardiopsis sp. B62]MBQ1083455.1 hypothetical protein [Nocardiopsis sp. B62]